MTRGQMLSILVFLSGGGYGVTTLQGHAETVAAMDSRMTALEEHSQSIRENLAALKVQGERNQQDLAEVAKDLKELNRELYRADPAGFGR